MGRSVRRGLAPDVEADIRGVHVSWAIGQLADEQASDEVLATVARGLGAHPTPVVLDRLRLVRGDERGLRYAVCASIFDEVAPYHVEPHVPTADDPPGVLARASRWLGSKVRR